MRTGIITINNKKYVMCFSARVMRDCIERYGNIEKIDEALSGGSEIDTLNECFWLMSKMLEAGYKYSEIEGLDSPVPPSEDELLDILDIDSMTNMRDSIKMTIANGSEREVATAETKGKNRKTTQGK